MLSTETGPRHGRVLLVISTRQNRGVRELNLTSTTLSDLFDPDVRLVYRHDGSETLSDQFVLALTDGTEVTRRTCRVTVTPVNDARPVLTTNTVLRVPRGSAAVITYNNLRANDDDSNDEQVRVMKLPESIIIMLLLHHVPQKLDNQYSLRYVYIRQILTDFFTAGKNI